MTNTTHIYNLDELQDRRIMMDKKLPPYGYALIILTGFLMVYLLLWSTKNYRTYVSQSTGTVQATTSTRPTRARWHRTRSTRPPTRQPVTRMSRSRP